MDTNYQLINSVDPSKCRAKIRDKFSKLTLSSNKKKQEDADMQQQIRENAALSNVSRNLMNDLLTDDESEEEKTEEKQPTENLLMRTNSSPSEDNVAPRKSSRQSMNTTHCTEAEESSVMEPLHVSETDNTQPQPQQNLEDAIETLSSRVSVLTVEGPMTISSNGSAHNLSQIVSTENQRMNAERRPAETTLTPKAREVEEDSICISSDTEESVITISDTSKSEEEFHANMTPSFNSVNHNTMVAVKQERMAKFLHDVKRNYGLAVTPERDFEDRCRRIATADTEPMSSETLSQSIGAARRIATAETESMSVCEEFTAAEQEEAVQNTSRGKLAAADTEDMTRASETMMSSPGYEPVMKVGTEFLDESVKDTRNSLPEDSLTIAETSEEEEEPQNDTNESQHAVRESKSPSAESKRSSSSSDQDSQFQINISAKINIKIQISQQQLQESMSSNSTEPSPANNRSVRDSLEEQQHSSAQKALPQPTALEDIPHSPPERDVTSELPKPDEKSPDDFERAERLLNELYGSSWKTPEVLHSLKKTTVRRNLPKPSIKPAPPNPTDDSSVGDFSIFRQNIPLDSTRLIESPSTFKTPRAIGRCSRSVRRVEIKSEEELKTSNTPVIKTKSGRSVQQRLAAIVDSDSESDGVNASGGSNQSWKTSDNEGDENTPEPVRVPKRRKPKNKISPKNDDDLVYLDLSKGEVEIQHNVSTSPPANNDANFNRRLEEILLSCKVKDKPKIESTAPWTGGKPKRKLFTAQIHDDDDITPPPFDSPREKLQNLIGDEASVSLSGGPLPSIFEPFNKHLEAVKWGKPIFKVHTPKSKRDTPESESPAPRTPKSALKESRVVGDICLTPKDTYGFLKSLDLCVGKSFCHPDALYYRDNYRQKRDELAHKLYEIYNRKCFNGELDVPLRWNKKLTNTAGRCMNKKRLGERTCVVELSEKVLTSADRLRCTLIHELCHAATWIINGEGGHGASWKAWARKANQIFPELPKIGVCHQYDIEYKYTYKCTLCAAKSHAHSKSKKVENIRCSYCHGAIEVYLNKKDKEGNIVATPVKEPAGFAKFVKEKYKTYKKPDLKHADVMKLLSSEFAAMKMDGKA